MEELTKSIQNTNSSLYHGTNVTVDIDPDWGLQVVTWDLSLRLTYAIEVWFFACMNEIETTVSITIVSTVSFTSFVLNTTFLIRPL